MTKLPRRHAKPREATRAEHREPSQDPTRMGSDAAGRKWWASWAIAWHQTLTCYGAGSSSSRQVPWADLRRLYPGMLSIRTRRANSGEGAIINDRKVMLAEWRMRFSKSSRKFNHKTSKCRNWSPPRKPPVLLTARCSPVLWTPKTKWRRWILQGSCCRWERTGIWISTLPKP